MANEENETVIDFPERVLMSGICTPETDVLIHEAKMAWVRPLNQAAAGLCKISDEGKDALRSFNKICRELGYPLLINDEEIEQL